MINLNNVKAALDLFNSSQSEYTIGHLTDSAELHEASFAAYEKDWAAASEHWRKAFNIINEKIPSYTKDDWYRSAAVAVRLGLGENLLNLFEKTGYNRIFRPLYEAIKALTTNSDSYLKNDVAAEVRDIALQIFQFMKNYNKSTKAKY